VRRNIDDAAKALEACLEVLRLANSVHELLAKKKHYTALRALDELQSIHLRQVSRYKIAGMIERSVPATQKLIAEAVMTDLNTWLFAIRERSQFLGEVAFYHTSERRERLKERSERDKFLTKFSLNSAIELVADELDEFDILNNDQTNTHIDFTPLFEAIHVRDTLGQLDAFRAEYAHIRMRQKDLLLPTSVNLLAPDQSDLRSLLENIAGFAIVEQSTGRKIDNLRSSSDIEQLWDSMAQTAIQLITASLPSVTRASDLPMIKETITLFIQTMEVCLQSVCSCPLPSFHCVPTS